MYDEVKYQYRTVCELRQEGCDTCQIHWQEVVRARDHESNRGEFDVVYCRRCRLGFTDPYPTEETSGYLYDNKEYNDLDAIVHDSPFDCIKDLLRRRQIARLAPRNQVRVALDFGTGDGRSAVAMTKVFPGARIDAMDIRTTLPRFLKRDGCRVNYYSQTAFTRHHQQYDLIIARHVLEHAHHPVRLVKQLSERLTSNGILYIEVPNLDSGCATFFGKHWRGYYVPQHIFHYTIESLAEVTKRAGLEAEMGRTEMPLMGNMVAILTGANMTSVVVRCLGVILHPCQLAIEAFCKSSTCITARCKQPGIVVRP